MTSIISEMLKKLFPASEYRVLMVGLDAAGKTSILYKLKLGEVVTTIPTIGFNVETVAYKGAELTMWDVGGCDKIRPLWRHYYQNTQALIMVVDSNDTQRMTHSEMSGDTYSYAQGMLQQTLCQDELRDCKVLVYLNKQDLPGALSPTVIEEKLGIDAFRRRGVDIYVQPCSATSGDGLYEGLDWLAKTLRNPKASIVSAPSASVSSQQTAEQEVVVEKKNPREELLESWLQREDEEDDLFLQKLRDCTLDSWDHYTHLRIAWLLLHRLGRREGLPLIFSQIKHFIANSPRTQRASANTRGTTFHETMTYFWSHMVHYAIVATPLPDAHKRDFKTFLLMNPQLSDGGLFLQYYSKQRMLLDPVSRESVQLPDIKPLPSLIPAENAAGKEHVFTVSAETKARLETLMPQLETLSDATFWQLALLRQLPSWGHAVKLRLLYVALLVFGRQRGGVDKVLAVVQAVEKEGFHLSLTYFWVQMLTLHMISVHCKEKLSNDAFGALTATTPSAVSEEGESGAQLVSAVLEKTLSFREFMQRASVDELNDQLLYEQYYSAQLLDDASGAQASLQLPDLKPMPSMI